MEAIPMCLGTIKNRVVSRQTQPNLFIDPTCFSCSPSDLNSVVTNRLLSYYVKWPLPPGDNPTAVNNNNNDDDINNNNNYYYYYYHHHPANVENRVSS